MPPTFGEYLELGEYRESGEYLESIGSIWRILRILRIGRVSGEISGECFVIKGMLGEYCESGNWESIGRVIGDSDRH
ncbi:hypothetical protein RCL_jg23016.t1 [Rhizophagus clarus]|uniref:Uncharacterized protein n=1 Tax=Rhizophagus clarus TaxID=94130 RepID=A0A8H3QGJ3_9GLOM|nr:hypothetical protein RCL_jg23016.t1 [Rhizophagus clarus]